MCRHHILEQLQGYQVEPNGTGAAYKAADRSSYNQHFRPTRLTVAKMEYGFNGFTLSPAIAQTGSWFAKGGYPGSYPIKQQPKLTIPQPWESPTVL